jgi:hypothetical protein
MCELIEVTPVPFYRLFKMRDRGENEQTLSKKTVTVDVKVSISSCHRIRKCF